MYCEVREIIPLFISFSLDSHSSILTTMSWFKSKLLNKNWMLTGDQSMAACQQWNITACYGGATLWTSCVGSPELLHCYHEQLQLLNPCLLHDLGSYRVLKSMIMITELYMQLLRQTLTIAQLLLLGLHNYPGCIHFQVPPSLHILLSLSFCSFNFTSISLVCFKVHILVWWSQPLDLTWKLPKLLCHLPGTPLAPQPQPLLVTWLRMPG